MPSLASLHTAFLHLLVLWSLWPGWAQGLLQFALAVLCTFGFITRRAPLMAGFAAFAFGLSVWVQLGMTGSAEVNFGLLMAACQGLGMWLGLLLSERPQTSRKPQASA